MKELKPLLILLIKFFLVYITLVLSYDYYLYYYNQVALQCDPATSITANQSAKLLTFLGYDTQTVFVENKPYVWMYMKNVYTTRVVEGCNAVSVTILFIAFIIAFSRKWSTTILYLIFGLISIYIINVLRIAWLNIIHLDFAQYNKIAHDYIFPAIVYGWVVFLWLVWMRFIVLKKEKNESKNN